MTPAKLLIAFYSRRGENYMGGDIVHLPIGNTELAASMIQKLAGGETFRIDTVQAYPADYTRATEVAQEELDRKARPELAADMADLAGYDLVILGYPNWWGTAPMPVFTFLEAHDFAGKAILPFCTHEGSGMGQSERDIQRACPGARVLKGLSMRGGSVPKAEQALAAWLRESGVIG